MNGSVDSVPLRAALGLAFVFFMSVVSAAPGSGQFQVTATSVPEVSQSGFCTTLGPSSATFGANVVVVCATGSVVDLIAPPSSMPWTPIHGGAYRYIHLTENELPGPRRVDGIDSFIGWGTYTAWRWVSLADRDYLELQLGW